MRQLFFSICMITSLLLLTGCKQRTDHPESGSDRLTLRDSVISLLDMVAETNQLAGLSVRLIAGDTTVLEYQNGLAVIEDRIPVTDSTIFRIASISKTFTAIALMQLHESKQVDLEADVSEYLGWSLRNPEYPDTPITLNMLMNHRSSIRDGNGYGSFVSSMFNEPLNISSLFLPDGAYFTTDMFATHEPGAFFSYTNCSWGLIASVVEKVSGMTLEDYCITHIFKPMEMDARFDPADLEQFENLGVLYRYKEGKWLGQSDQYNGERPEPKTDSTYIPGTNGLLYGPQGGLRCSVGDLEKVARLFWNQGNYKNTRILTPESLELMTRDHWTFAENNGDTWDGFFLSYGLGVHRITATEGKDVIFKNMKMSGHPGIAFGLLSDLYFDVNSKTAVIFITNGSKKDYEYGVNSTFYQPEEDAFRALNLLLTPKN